MNPVALKLPSARQQPSARTGDHPVRQALAALLPRVTLDAIREPAGLQYPMSTRARRLMRNARAGG